MIRLARRGKKNAPFYRVIVSEKARDMFGKALEIVGHYNPVSAKKDIQLNEERIKYWISKGAGVSDTVHNLLVDNNIMTGPKKQKLAKKKEKKKS
jgi:small subunit ribosomal protein S16